MTTQNNTLNIDSKSNLAKLIATENLTVQFNNVKTASFDTLNRILTLPNFKISDKDVYDMLIAHECAHALFTPTDGWKQISSDDELRAYCNVLEDCRIDKKIQKKFPGTTSNYLKGFDVLNNNNFFGIKDKNLNTDLMLIDKINLYFKSSKRLNINWSKKDKEWLDIVDSIKTWKDVVRVAKLMLDWQKKQLDKMKKMPDFDNHVLVENYGLDDNKDSDNNVNTKENSNGEETDKQDEGSNTLEDKKNNKEDSDTETAISSSPDARQGGGSGLLKAITNEAYESKVQNLIDKKNKFRYANIPDPRLNNVVISTKDFVNDMKQYFANEIKQSPDKINYANWLKQEYKKIKNDNKKTVMYLVKEFEMKKAATAYKRATTDKTGVIDTLKLKDYKFSDDIFKRLTILPNAKNHGMMFLLDWSGSMHQQLHKTVLQLLNLIWFCQKVNIPFEVYLFTSEYYRSKGDSNTKEKLDTWNFKSGDAIFDRVNLVQVAHNKLKKTQLDETLTYLLHLATYYQGYFRSYDYNDRPWYDSIHIPENYTLGNTPLNEGLIACLKLIPMFKEKNKIEKMSFITLTDGGANGSGDYTAVADDGTGSEWDKLSEGLRTGHRDSDGTLVFTFDKKRYVETPSKRFTYSGERMTQLLLKIIQSKYNVKTIGFYLVNRISNWDSDRIFGEALEKSTWSQRDEFLRKQKSILNKEKTVVVPKNGYNKYFLVNAKKLDIENNELKVQSDAKVSDIKRLFSKNMKGRITSRVLLNNFIAEVA